jgi:LPS-assembly lipoprotein
MARARWPRAVLVAGSLLLASCGFHLRGQSAVEVPPQLRTLRVTMQGADYTNDSLRESVINALREELGVTVEESGNVPVLQLFSENYQTRVASVSTNVTAAEYLILYDVSFQVTSADGKSQSARQTIRLQRDYSFDPLNVLAMEREERELRQDMRRDAVQQILRRLTKIHLEPPGSGQKSP